MTSRQIGPFGTLARVLGGAAAVALPIALRGFTWPEAAIALLALPLIAVMVLANSALVAPTSADGNVTIWVWLGASMLVAAARGYDGCEVLATWNLLTGRRDRIGCLLYTPIDAAETRRLARSGGAI